MKVLHVIATLDPKGGGPMAGVRMLAQEVLQHGATIEVATLDAPDSDFINSFPAKVHALGPARGKYGYCPSLARWLRANAKKYDAVVVNGIWQYHGLAVRRALAGTDTPYFVFTHGMLDPWFKHAYPLKHLKKWIYWLFAEYRVLRDARAVIFTCEEERRLAKETFWLYRVREAVTAYGTASPPADGPLKQKFLSKNPELRGKRLLLFLSRIHEKKGCDLLISAFARLARAHPDVHLVMAGPDQGGLVSKLQLQAEELAVADRISWPGMLSGDDKWGAFYASEAFCLPSHQENFGIVVAEALACSLPVLISDKVNIWREIEFDGAGVIAEDTIDGTERSLTKWLSLSSQAQAEMRERAKACFETRFRIDHVAKDVLRILSENGASSDSRKARDDALFVG